MVVTDCSCCSCFAGVFGCQGHIVAVVLLKEWVVWRRVLVVGHLLLCCYQSFIMLPCCCFVAEGGYDEPEYFVKYAKRSHLHNEWVSESTLAQIAKRKLINFKRHYGTAPVNMFKSEWAQPERFLARRQCRTGPGWEVLVKWKDLGYEHCTWEVSFDLTTGRLKNKEAMHLFESCLQNGTMQSVKGITTN